MTLRQKAIQLNEELRDAHHPVHSVYNEDCLMCLAISHIDDAIDVLDWPNVSKSGIEENI